MLERIALGIDRRGEGGNRTGEGFVQGADPLVQNARQGRAALGKGRFGPLGGMGHGGRATFDRMADAFDCRAHRVDPSVEFGGDDLALQLEDRRDRGFARSQFFAQDFDCAFAAG